MNLANLHICNCSTEQSLCQAISTKIKYVSLFDLFLTWNQAKLVMFKVQRISDSLNKGLPIKMARKKFQRLQ